jgi:superfamily II DNA or RNA helicase
MLEQAIQDIIRKQRPYYLHQGNPIKGVENQYWLVFKHRDADNFFQNIFSFFNIGEKNTAFKFLRIDPKTAKVYEYTPIKDDNLPSTTLLRTSKIAAIEYFLNKPSITKEQALIVGSFLELQAKRSRRFSLPDELNKYQNLINSALERSQIYRRSTAYFDSGVLKLYEEPIQNIIRSQGTIRLLMDWQGFTKVADITELEKLQNPEYRSEFTRRTLQEFLQGLAEKAFTGTQIMAELVRLGMLQIKLVKMHGGRPIYHKKTGILTDGMENHILHEGSDNFTRAAHSTNAEAVTFLYSWDDLDRIAIAESIQQFDREWEQNNLAFDLTQEFLQQVLAERERRTQQQQPIIESISPEEFPPGETTTVEITGKNLDKVENIQVADDELVQVTITNQEPEKIIGEIDIHPEHPPTKLNDFRVKTSGGTYNTSPRKPASVSKSLEIPEYGEIPGFKQAIEIILAGTHGKPKDFLYWLAQQRIHQFQIESSDILDELVYNGTLFEHQKSGAQHCLQVMRRFGVVVGADAVGLGKTRFAATVAKLYLQDKPDAKIVIVAAKKLFPNWEREMAELGFEYEKDYELFNKNLMSRKGSSFLDYYRLYDPDLIIIDEAHEGIRNYHNRVHKTCLEIQAKDKKIGKQRHFLLLTATPWNNRREDIYNILSPFINRPEGFRELGFTPELSQWFENRDTGVENFTDNTDLFRQTYRELFLQRTRQMLRDATPDLNLYAKRIAEWLPVVFEPSTEQALEQIFTQFENSLFIPFLDPIKYLKEGVEERSLLANQRRFFLQRAESSMYALNRTIKCFGDRICNLQAQLETITPDADGLKQFLLIHYKFESPVKKQATLEDFDREGWDENYEEEEEEEEENPEQQQQKRQQLRRSIEIATNALQTQPEKVKAICDRILADCEGDLQQLAQIQNLLAGEFIIDHKREQVTRKVKELVTEGKKVLLISTFSDTVIDYYRYMYRDAEIANYGIGMAIGATKHYYPNNQNTSLTVTPHNFYKQSKHHTGIKRAQVFRLFAPAASCKNPSERPQKQEEISVLIGSETLSVGQNLQDADYLINIDLPWNPMVLEQRIGRIDRPKSHPCENIYIYYANSESQLLRQASRLANLNKKLVGELASNKGEIPEITNVESLGASIYGDTLFDDEVLPGYLDFLHSLAKVRKLEQTNLQEAAYQQQETNSNLYTHNEILYSEELSKLLKELGDDYQANANDLRRASFALGRRTETTEPTGLVALTIEYFGPNNEPIPRLTQTIFWNEGTGEKDGYGFSIAIASKTPEISGVISAPLLIENANNLYQQLVHLKQQKADELEQNERDENINTTSERVAKIQKRVQQMSQLPPGLERKTVRETLKKLSAWKESHRSVQKLLREYTDGSKANLDDKIFLPQLVDDTDKLNLLSGDGIKPISLKVSLAAILLRVED